MFLSKIIQIIGFSLIVLVSVKLFVSPMLDGVLSDPVMAQDHPPIRKHQNPTLRQKLTTGTKKAWICQGDQNKTREEQLLGDDGYAQTSYSEYPFTESLYIYGTWDAYTVNGKDMFCIKILNINLDYVEDKLLISCVVIDKIYNDTYTTRQAMSFRGRSILADTTSEHVTTCRLN